MRDQVLIIAEAGVNHNGSMDTAKKLIDAAAEAGVDYVKFQTFKADKMVTKTASRATYQDTNTRDKDSQFDMLKKLEISEDMHLELIHYCQSKKIKFLSTAFDLESLAFLKSLGLGLAKIPSGEITNLPYLRAMAKLFPEIILSTGMANMDEIKAAFRVLIENGTRLENITILHCNTEYPTPMGDVNLKAMLHIKKESGVEIGYSDHTLGIEVPIAAVALGAKVIEKHFIIDKSIGGADCEFSMDKKDFRSMVQHIRETEKLLGTIDYAMNDKKSQSRNFSRSLYICKDIKEGEVFTQENIRSVRPGYGMHPKYLNDILGTKAKKSFSFADRLEIE